MKLFLLNLNAHSLVFIFIYFKENFYIYFYKGIIIVLSPRERKMIENCRDKIWIYKWDKLKPGIFYGISTTTKRTVKGKINLSLESNACNWILLFVKNKETVNKLKFLKFMKVKCMEIDEYDKWWCVNSDIGPYEFVKNKHVLMAVFLYINSFNLHKYSHFIYNNRKLFNIENVASLHPEEMYLLNSQYFIQHLRRNENFSPIGLFDVLFSEDRQNLDDSSTFEIDGIPVTKIVINDPFVDFVYVSSDFAFRPNFKIMSFDLEMAIINGKNDFPNGLHEDEKIVGISCVSSEMDGVSGREIPDSRVTKMWMLIPKNTSYKLKSEFVSKINLFCSEKDMILDYIKYSESFHVITGYNINMFDNNMLIARCLLLNVDVFVYSKNRRIKILDWMSKVDFENIPFVLPHQDNIDLIQYFKRFYQGKQLSSYKLDDVAEAILNEKKTGFQAYKLHELYTNLFRNKTNVEFLDELCSYMETDALLPLKIFYELSVYNFVNVLCSLSYCNIDNIFGPISMITINCLLYRLFYPERKPFSYERNLNYGARRWTNVIKDVISKKRKFEYDDDADENENCMNLGEKHKKKKYQGAYVIEPTTGMYENVMIFDFASLYPSLMIKYNISPSYLYRISECEYKKDTIFYNTNFYSINMKTHYNMTPKNSITPLANIEKMLVEQRSVYKKRKDESAYCSNMEKVIKIYCNAIYGLTGADSFVSDHDVAATITAYGRQHLMQCQDFFEQLGFNVIYGDTDSVFVAEKIVATEKNMIERNKNELSDNCNDKTLRLKGNELIEMFYKWTESNFPKLEMEDSFPKLMMISKKCYVGLRNNGTYKRSGFPKKIPQCISKLYDDVINFIFKEPKNDVNSFKTWLSKKITVFVEMTRTKPETFVQMKTVKSNLYAYSKKCNLPHVIFARELEHRGMDLSTLGGHIYYVPIIKDIEGKWVGIYYELDRDVANLTIDLYTFVSSYTGKLNSLLYVKYGFKKKYIDEAFKVATQNMKIIRLKQLKPLIKFVSWDCINKKRLKSIPDVRHFFENWYNFATKCNVFPNIKPDKLKIYKSIKLKWLPNEGFSYSFNNYISQWKTLIEIETYFIKNIKVIPQFQIIIEENQIWYLKDFLKEILNLTCNEILDETRDFIYVTQYGVFNAKSLEISDCIEKLLIR